MSFEITPKQIAFNMGLPLEVYDKNPEDWNCMLLTIYSIYLVQELNGYSKIKMSEKTLNKFASEAQKIKNYIELKTTLYLGLHQVFSNPEKLINNRFPQGNNYNSNLNILMNFPQGAGGHFLRNCLYFSDDISCIGSDFCHYSFNKEYIDEVILNIVNNKKIDYSQVDEFKYFLRFKELNKIEDKLNHIISETKSQRVWVDPCLNLNSQIDQYNIHTLHDMSISDIVNYELSVWPNCKVVIHFKNSNLFTSLRKYPKWFLEHHDVPWFMKDIEIDFSNYTKETFLNFIDQPQEHKKNIMNKLNDKVQINSLCNLNSKRILYAWDTNWYLSERDTIDHIKELYKILSLSGFNKDAISKYYNVWIKTMNDLKVKSLNEIT